MKLSILIPLLLTFAGCLGLAGCEQKTDSVSRMSPAVAKSFQKATLVDGTVSTGRSLIKSGDLAVTDENGKVIKQVKVNNGRFSVEIPAGTALPVLLTFAPENGGEKLLAVAVNPNVTRYYIDPSSTAIAKAAKAMGGYTHANVTRAAEATTHTPDANKTTTGWRGDPTTQYGGWH